MWTRPCGPVRVDPSVRMHPCGPVHVDASVWTRPCGRLARDAGQVGQLPDSFASDIHSTVDEREAMEYRDAVP
jgi:hypothetical protein